MTMPPIALVALAFALSAAAKEKSGLSAADAAPEKPVLGAVDASSDITDPEMLKTLAAVEASNLENALSKGRAEAEKAVGFIVSLTAALKLHAGELDAETDTAYTPDLAPISALDASFRKAAEACGFKPATSTIEKLVALRQGYRAKDRLRDLRMSEDWNKAAAKKAPTVRLDEVDERAAAAAAALAVAAQNLSAQALKLDPRHASRRAAITADIEALKTESLLFRLSLLLSAHDQAAFDTLPDKDEAAED